MAEQSTDTGGALLPKAHVLNYVARVSTPTRVRRIAATCSVALAVVYFALAVTLGGWLFTVIRNLMMARRFFPPFIRGRGFLPPPSPSFWDYVNVTRLEFEEYPLPFLALAGCVLLGATAAAFAGSVKGGKRTASYCVLATVVPLMIFAAVVTATYIAAAAVDVFNLSPPRKLESAWYFLVVPIGALVILLMVDLCSFLWWIARNPITDKPAGALPFSKKGKLSGAALQ